MFENERIRVVEYKIAPSDMVNVSMPGPCLLTALSESTLRINDGDATQLSEREVLWTDAGIQTIEAVGDSESQILLAHIKEQIPPPATAIRKDDGTIHSPDAYHLLFENERARVVWVSSEPGTALTMHSHPGRAFRYFLTQTRVRLTVPNGSVFEVNMTPGTVRWEDEPSSHGFENISDARSHVVLIEVR